jgi:hypothetical protein
MSTSQYRIAPKKGLADSALRAQKFWDAGVSQWDGEDFKKSQNSMNGLFGKLRSMSTVNLEEMADHDDATYTNMMQEEMAMADLGFDCGWGFDDDLTQAAILYCPGENVVERKTSSDSIPINRS